MPRPHEQRPSKLRNAASRPGDDADAHAGGWSRERLTLSGAKQTSSKSQFGTQVS